MIYYPDIIGYHGIDYAFVNGINATALDLGGSVWGGNYIIPTTVLFTNTGPNMCYASIGQNVELLQPFSKTIIGGAGKADCFITGELYSKIRVDAYTYKITGAAKASLYDNTLNADKYKADVLCVIPFDSGPLTPANPDTIAGFPTRANRTVTAALNTPLASHGYVGRGTEYIPQSFMIGSNSLKITVTNTNYASDPFKKMTVEFNVHSGQYPTYSFYLGLIAAPFDYDYVGKFESGASITNGQRVMSFLTSKNSSGEFYYFRSSNSSTYFDDKKALDLSDFIKVAITIDFTRPDNNIALFIDGKLIDSFTDFNFSSFQTNLKYFGFKIMPYDSGTSISNVRITENIRYTGSYAKFVRSYRDLY